MLKEIKGNILDFDGDIICHQTNCSSRNSAGLAKQIFDKYPVANTYKNRTRTEIDSLGKCDFRKVDKFWIANMNAQVYAGKYMPIGAATCDRYMDSPSIRLKAFDSCLHELGLFCLDNQLTRIAFPLRIGSGLAGGDWNKYKQKLSSFAAENPQFQVFIINPFL